MLAPAAGHYNLLAFAKEIDRRATDSSPSNKSARLNGTMDEALKLRRPAPDGTLKIVATGEKEDVA